MFVIPGRAASDDSAPLDSESLPATEQSDSNNYSQPESEEIELDANSTLQDYLLYAASNNAELKAAFSNWQAAAQQIPQAKTLPDPEILYGYAIEDTPQRFVVDVMQKFPWPGTLKARAGSASAAAGSARKQYESKRLQLFYEVKYVFYEYCFLAKAVTLTTESLDLLKHFEEIARTRYATSEASHPDVIRAQVELAILENELKTFTKSKPPIEAKLNSILNRPVSNELPWPQMPQYKQAAFDTGQLIETVMQNNPDIQSLGYDIAAGKSNVELAKKKFYPEIGVGFGIDEGMGADGENRYMPKLSVNLPLWRGSYKAGELQAKAMLNKTVQEKIQLGNNLAAKTQQILYELDDSGRKIALYGDFVIPKTKEMLTASETSYRAGGIDFFSLIDAQRKLLKYQLEYERALADNAQKQAEIEMLAGTELSMLPVKSENN